MSLFNKIEIFDTTLRDGQQCPGAGISLSENIYYANLVAEAGIDILEAGFPASSDLEFDVVQKIAKEYASKSNSPKIAALSQLRQEQIDKTIRALEPAIEGRKARLHLYVPVDPSLMKASLGKYSSDHSRIIQDAYSNIKRAHQIGLEVQFSLEGYSRQGKNFDFSTDLIRAAIEGGTKIINCPDTLGLACKLQTDYFVNQMIKHSRIVELEFPDKEITWSVHCHNDFGLALENTMMALFHGPARQIEGCFNGIGERAGNVPLEQCIMYLRHFSQLIDPVSPFFTEVNTQMIQQISDFVSKHMLPRQPHWPITGENAMKHSSGGHTNAILKDPSSYQPFDPMEVGRSIEFIFGPSSGGNHAQAILKKYGYECPDIQKAKFAQYIKERGHRS